MSSSSGRPSTPCRLAGNDNGFTVSNSGLLSIASAALLANDSDPDGDPLTITSVGNATNGTRIAQPADRRHHVYADLRLYRAGKLLLHHIGWPGRNGVGRRQRVRRTIRHDGESVFAVQRAQHSFRQRPGFRGTGREVPTSSPGIITGMRYYKSAQDIGTHTGSLWTSTGTLLANATFTNESASGWQTVTFTQPIAVSAGTTYVASYHSNGYYGVTPNFFATNYTNGPLMAPASSGTAAETVSSPMGRARSSRRPPTVRPTTGWMSSMSRWNGNLRPVAGDDPGLLRVVQHAARASGEHLARQ